MSKRPPNSFLISSSKLRLHSPRLYQRILAGVIDYEALASQILTLIQPARAFRDLDSVREMATILRNVPIERYRLVGDYYLVWCECREGEYNTEALESIIDRTNGYKAKGLLLRAAMEGYQSNIDAEIYFYKEALKASPTVSEYIAISNAIAVVKAKQGSHQLAIRDLERLVPLIRYADPLAYFDLLNSYAVELGEVGRVTEACNISRLVLASPLAFAYPEWQQTGADLRGGSRSIVQVAGSRASSGNVLSLPPTPERVIQSPPLRPGERTGILLDYMRFKKKMVKKKKSKPDESIDEMDRKDLVVKMLELISPEDIDEKKLREVVKHAAEVLTDQK